MDLSRIRIIKEGKHKKGPVFYWMSRDQRVKDNWALVYAQKLALKMKVPLGVIFCLVPSFSNATIRQYDFMLNGLKEVERDLFEKNINFYLLNGSPPDTIPTFIQNYDASVLITDFDPLKIKRTWKQKVSENIDIPFYEIDTHNIVPCWLASPKLEYAAYTFRPKIKRLLNKYLTEISKIKKHPYSMGIDFKEIDTKILLDSLDIDRNVLTLQEMRPGEKAAFQKLLFFISKKLGSYDKDRNNPAVSSQSDLSPYLHFGQISPQRVAVMVIKSDASNSAKNSFLEELIVRRELSDNFCFYNKEYDNFNGFPQWAKKTLQQHLKDKREYLYSKTEFEKAITHDELWNAAQWEIIKRGKIHGYMRMYWAKKILEWSESPYKALEIAIYLNDKYSIDGIDPNGYTGIAWSIGGVHDRAWKEREVFGKIRYMSYGGCKSKFDVGKYIEKINSL